MPCKKAIISAYCIVIQSASVLLKTGKRISRHTAEHFLMGYFLIIRKPGSPKMISKRGKPGELGIGENFKIFS